MDQRLEKLEQSMETISINQHEFMNHMAEMMERVTNKVEQIEAQSTEMDQRIGQLEIAMSAISLNEQDFMLQMVELMNKLNSQVDHIETQTVKVNIEDNQVHGGGEDNVSNESMVVDEPEHSPTFSNLDFPCFNGGEDPTSWLEIVEKFCRFQLTPDERWVTIASYNLQGDAHKWYQELRKEKNVITWNEFKNGLVYRFGEEQRANNEDSTEDYLAKLKQNDLSVRDYQTQFEQILAQAAAGRVPRNQQVKLFVNGLKDSLRTDVQTAKPVTLSAAIGFARLYEARNDVS